MPSPTSVNSVTSVTSVTLVSGGNYQQREALIADLIADLIAPSTKSLIETSVADTDLHIPKHRIAVILEGLPGGDSVLNNSSTLLLQRIAPGCMCCIGNLAMRVTLNRLLRQRPAQLFIGIASTEHIDKIRAFLSQAPYRDLLSLNPDHQIL
ncbi:GTPase [Undibacterium sp. RuTC16W]|uniref:GTPase n=1 Tax=Undibacterium sp. RuTC16W TaxID=3413048 RepID=UPI003BF344FD